MENNTELDSLLETAIDNIIDTASKKALFEILHTAEIAEKGTYTDISVVKTVFLITQIQSQIAKNSNKIASILFDALRKYEASQK